MTHLIVGTKMEFLVEPIHINATEGRATILGNCDPAFSKVLDVFVKNFSERGEIGSGISIYQNGSKVVDLWGGWLDAGRSRAWERESLCSVYSISKSLCALSVHVLVERGRIDLEAPVAHYWPEFAQSGKDKITVRQVLSHHCGVLFNDRAKPGDIYDWETMIDAIAAQEPAWPAGTKGAYNSVNFGYINGELVRRVDGRMIDTFISDEICVPLGVEFHFGVGSVDPGRVADMIDNPANPQYRNADNDETTLARAWNAMPTPRNAGMVNDGHRKYLYPSGGGFTTARSIARIYAMLANDGELDGVRILKPETVERLQTEQWEEDADGMMGMHIRMALGFMKNSPPAIPMGPGRQTFGHYGSNGALAFADRNRNLAFGTTTNFLTAGPGVGDRTAALVTAAYL